MVVGRINEVIVLTGSLDKKNGRVLFGEIKSGRTVAAENVLYWGGGGECQFTKKIVPGF